MSLIPPPSSSSRGSGDEEGHDFESYFRWVCSDLEKKGEVQGVSELFATLENDEDRMAFVLQRELLPLSFKTSRECNYAPKDRAESAKCRNGGNAVYQKNKISEALELYSRSVCAAPHPPPAEGGGGGILPPLSGGGEEPENRYEELALGYANRSAVLFQMKEYELCVRDITRAFDNGYPNNLMYKLFERKARCLKALKDYPRALESMKNAEMWMQYSTLNETKSSSFKKEIAKQIEFLEERVFCITDVSELSKNMLNHKKSLVAPLKIFSSPRIPEDSSNQEVTGVKANVELKYSKEKGRHFVATSDIEPGQVLITETPYSSILLPEYYNTHCQSCFQRVIAPIPCWCCARVRFCSDQCRFEAWERFHKLECQQLDLILNSGVGKNAMLAMRILTSSGKIYLEYIINKVLGENESRRVSGKKEEEVQRMLGFNEDDVYNSADYRTIYTLITNVEQRGVGDLFKRTLMALYLLNILEMTSFFYNGGSDPRNVKTQDKVMMGAVILRHLQNLPCNAHEISEIEYSSCNLKDATVHEIGAACYGVLSLLNHSCDPNVVRHYYNSDAIVRSIRGIKKGEELLDNYGYHYAVMPKTERQRKLYNQYYFQCDCQACESFWPNYSNIPTTPVYLGSTDPSRMSEVQKSSKNFKKIFEELLNGGDSEVAIVPLLDHLRLLDKSISRPYREYNDCQEALKQCWSAQGNSLKIMPSEPSTNGNKKDVK